MESNSVGVVPRRSRLELATASNARTKYSSCVALLVGLAARMLFQLRRRAIGMVKEDGGQLQSASAAKRDKGGQLRGWVRPVAASRIAADERDFAALKGKNLLQTAVPLPLH